MFGRVPLFVVRLAVVVARPIARGRKEKNLMFTKEFKCLVCEKPENQCTCNRYCALCHADYELRLTDDGQYYCRDCREACDYKTQDQV
jgi:hypothetical protein